MKKVLIVIILIYTAAFGAADRADSLLANYFDKIESELSGLNDPGTVTNQDWVETKLVRPITAIVARLERDNNLNDYVSAQTAFDNAGIITVPADTIIQAHDGLELSSNTFVTGTGALSNFKMVKSNTTSTYNLKIDADSNIVISNVSFLGDKTNSGTYGTEFDHNILIMNGAKNIMFLNCIFDALGDGIYVGSDGDRSTYPTNIYVVNCYFRGDSLTSYNPPCSRNGISVVHGEDINIVNCVFDGFHEPGCFDLEPNTDQWCRNVNVSNCKFNQAGGGVLLGGRGIVENVNISNCNFDLTKYDGAGYGIRAIAATQNPNVNKVNITNCTFIGDTTKQVVGKEYIRIIGQSWGVNVSNCSFYNSLGAAVQINGNAELINVVNSTFHYCFNGVGIYGDHWDSTAAHFDSSKFGTAVPDWLVDSEQTSRIDSSDGTGIYYLATQSAGADTSEGFGFVINTVDTSSIYEFTARMYVQSDAYAAVTAHVNNVDKEIPCMPVYTTPDSTKRLLKYWFQPTGTDTIWVLARSKFGTTHIKIDSIAIEKATVARKITIDNNKFINPRNAGVSASYLYESKILNNVVEKRLGYNQEPDPLSFDYGFFIERMVKSDFIGNESESSDYLDVYLSEAYLSKFDFTNIGKFYRDYLLPSSGNIIVDTQSITIQLDSLYAGLDTTIVVGNCLGRGIVTGMTGALYGDMTGGNCIVQPTYGGYYSPEFNAREYLTLNFSDIGTNKDYCVDTTNLLSGKYVSTVTTTTNTHYGIPGIGENLLGIRVSCDGSFASTRQAKLIVSLQYQ